MTRRVLSLDFDGCFANRDYLALLQQGENQATSSIRGNKGALNHIQESDQLFTKNIVMVGSNRQSKRVDDFNNTNSGSGSCFTAIKAIAEYLGAELDTFLLADLYHDLEGGTSFNRAINPLHSDHKDWVFDHTKASILYAQIHRSALAAAQENPGESIIFDFYDDRTDILEALEGFYSEHPELIPTNVTLRLNHYEPIFGQEEKNIPTKQCEIQGNGFIDQNYYQTVKKMAELCDKKEHSTPQMNVAKDLNVSQLTGREPFDSKEKTRSQEPVHLSPSNLASPQTYKERHPTIVPTYSPGAGDKEEVRIETQKPASLPTYQRRHLTIVPTYSPGARDKEEVKINRQATASIPAIPASSSAVSLSALESEIYAKAAEALNQLCEFHLTHLSTRNRREKWKSKGLSPTVSLNFIDYQPKTNPLLEALRHLGVTLREIQAACYGEKIVSYSCSLNSLSQAQAIPAKVRDIIEAASHAKRREVESSRDLYHLKDNKNDQPQKQKNSSKVPAIPKKNNLKLFSALKNRDDNKKTENTKKTIIIWRF